MSLAAPSLNHESAHPRAEGRNTADNSSVRLLAPGAVRKPDPLEPPIPRPAPALRHEMRRGPRPVERGTAPRFDSPGDVTGLFIGGIAARGGEAGSRNLGTRRPQTAGSDRGKNIRDQERSREMELSAWAQFTRPGTAHRTGNGSESRVGESDLEARPWEDASLEPLTGNRRISDSVAEEEIDIRCLIGNVAEGSWELSRRQSKHNSDDTAGLSCEDVGLVRSRTRERQRKREEELQLYDDVGDEWEDGADIEALLGQYGSSEDQQLRDSVSLASSVSCAAPWHYPQSLGDVGSEVASERASHRTSGSLFDSTIPHLSAPGLDDARALLRTWIDSEHTFGGLEGVHVGGLEFGDSWQVGNLGLQRESVRDLRSSRLSAQEGREVEKNHKSEVPDSDHGALRPAVGQNGQQVITEQDAGEIGESGWRRLGGGSPSHRGFTR